MLLTGPEEPFFPGRYTYNLAGLSMAPDTKYWVVVEVADIDTLYGWNLQVTEPTGSEEVATSSNAGASWTTFTGEEGRPPMFSVAATPSGFLAPGAAALFLPRKHRS